VQHGLEEGEAVQNKKEESADAQVASLLEMEAGARRKAQLSDPAHPIQQKVLLEN